MARAAAAAPTLAPEDDSELVRRLVAGDEDAFEAVLDRYSSVMMQVALGYVADRGVAEEVVHEAWLAVIDKIDEIDELADHGSFRTWLFRLLADRARARHSQGPRSVPQLHRGDQNGGGRCVPLPVCEANDRDGDDGMRSAVWMAIDQLTGPQRQVVVLRDVAGWPARDVCEVLALTEADHVALLHRARTSVRATLVPYLDRSNSRGLAS